MSIASTFTAITGIVLGKKNPHQGKKVLFHEKALQYGQHGVLLANNKARGFESERIRFVFDGIIEAPAMTPELMEHIWSEAVKQGYEPLNLLAYGSKANPSIAGVSSKINDKRIGNTRVVTPAQAAPVQRKLTSNSVLQADAALQENCADHSSSFFDTLQQQNSGNAAIPNFLRKSEENKEPAAV